MLVAVQALTRVPVRVAFDAGALRKAVRYMPLVGIGVGLVAAGVFEMAAAGVPRGVAGLLSLGATLLLTGGLHEDGLADCCDGLFGGRDREGALRIMRDSRVGAFGVLGVVVVVGIKVSCLAALPEAGVALIAGHACSRFWAVVPPAVLPYARAEGLGAGVARPGMGDLMVAGVFGLLPLLLLGPRAVPALLLSVVAVGGVGLYARHRLGGYTGDVLGAVQQMTEVAVLLAALWRAG